MLVYLSINGSDYMDKYDENDIFFNVNLVSAITNNIFHKGVKKVSKISFLSSIPFILLIIICIIFNPSLVTLPIIGLLFSGTTSIATHFCFDKKRIDEWKNYCDDYKLYKNKPLCI